MTFSIHKYDSILQEVFSEVRMNYRLLFDAKDINNFLSQSGKKIIANYIKKDTIFQINAL
jgi:hypothetical protein